VTYDVVVADDRTGASDTLVQFLPCSERAIVFPSLRGQGHRQPDKHDRGDPTGGAHGTSRRVIDQAATL
jgi:hypothetical protein